MSTASFKAKTLPFSPSVEQGLLVSLATVVTSIKPRRYSAPFRPDLESYQLHSVNKMATVTDLTPL